MCCGADARLLTSASHGTPLRLCPKPQHIVASLMLALGSHANMQLMSCRLHISRGSGMGNARHTVRWSGEQGRKTPSALASSQNWAIRRAMLWNHCAIAWRAGVGWVGSDKQSRGGKIMLSYISSEIKNPSTPERCFMDYEIGRKVEMFKESGNSFHYQREAKFLICCWVTVDLRPSDVVMWHWPRWHWWHFKAMLYHLVFFSFVLFCFSRRALRAIVQKGMPLWPWKQIFKR